MEKNVETDTSVYEIRRKNLLLLVEKYGSMAQINTALGRGRYNSALTQIKNRAFNKTTGTRRRMGPKTARLLEFVFKLGTGWMDKLHDNADDVPEIEIPPAGGTKSSTNTNPLLNEFRKFLTQEMLNVPELRTYFIEKSPFPSIPTESPVIVDISCRQFVKKGIYLIRAEEELAFRKIVGTADDKYRVWSDPDKYEDIEDLSVLRILGRVVFQFDGRSFL